ncbi:hypothetical protein DFH06DRAFT_1319485 [Mycena polygramma]|nr:hypothetical protein DFH06DRAFT_1348834 [Mycena polygramma]KAJ7673273.1 hypothetical protein DFH06DRAFT_1319485 [Mycena polygramma]
MPIPHEARDGKRKGGAICRLRWQTYQWARRTQSNQEWTCINANGYVIIASYSLKAAGEPEYLQQFFRLHS